MSVTTAFVSQSKPHDGTVTAAAQSSADAVVVADVGFVALVVPFFAKRVRDLAHRGTETLFLLLAYASRAAT